MKMKQSIFFQNIYSGGSYVEAAINKRHHGYDNNLPSPNNGYNIIGDVHEYMDFEQFKAKVGSYLFLII